MLKTVIKIICVSLLMLLLGSCAGSKKEKKPELPAEKTEKMNESFDPLTLNDADLNFDKTKEEPKSSQSIQMPKEQPPAEIENRLVDGFRIQIISTKEIESANRAKQIAMERFGDLNVNFYLEFDSPYYKVRLGDFQDREAAEKVREIVRTRGYPKAWIVKAKVWSNPQSSAPGDSTNAIPPNVKY